MASISKGSTSAQLRADIDSGATGDKVPGFDPAAAPLGVDEEAAGTPPSPEVIAQARQAESSGGPHAAHPNAAEPALQPNAAGGRGAILTPILVGVGAAVLLLLVLVVVLLV